MLKDLPWAFSFMNYIKVCNPLELALDHSLVIQDAVFPHSLVPQSFAYHTGHDGSTTNAVQCHQS